MSAPSERLVDRLRALPRKYTLVLGAVLAFLLISIFFNGPHIYLTTDSRTSDGVQRSWRRSADYDLVVAYYNEPLDSLHNTLKQVTESLPRSSSHRIIIYYKGDMGDVETYEDLKRTGNEVVVLENAGREGETYLNHIARHYKGGKGSLAKWTIFMQPHLAWEWQFLPRLNDLSTETGFMSFGPYTNQTCGIDSTGNSFPRMADIYSIFRGEFCPPTSQLATWAGQFVVSRKRILDNPYKSYETLLGYFHADPDHWIWKEGWWNNDKSNPTLGHALERTWPVIFNCADPIMAEECGEGSGEGCQCLDGVSPRGTRRKGGGGGIPLLPGRRWG